MTTAPPAVAAPSMRLRHLGVVSLISLGIALFLTAMEGGGFAWKLAYSLLIGLGCSLGMDLGRTSVDTFNRRRAAARGLPAPSRWWGVAAGTVLAVTLGPLLGLSIADALSGNRSPSLLNWASTGTRVTLGMVLLGTAVATVVAVSMERLASARARAEAAQRQAAEHQLRLLQSQLEPHMLFNTLANLRVLIGMDAARAQAMLDHLIAYLRAPLQASRQPQHALAAEFERTSDYLALMGVRMGDRLQVALDLPEALRALPVPPLLLQPLVENAILHGLEPHVAGGRVAVSARREGHELVLAVRDNGAGLAPAAPAPGQGFGLAQVRERLATLYGSRARLVLTPLAEGGTLATVVLPLPGPAAAEPFTATPT
jgi:signal transduction histidine kinase